MYQIPVQVENPPPCSDLNPPTWFNALECLHAHHPLIGQHGLSVAFVRRTGSADVSILVTQLELSSSASDTLMSLWIVLLF